MNQPDLFGQPDSGTGLFSGHPQWLSEGAVLFKGALLAEERALLQEIGRISAQRPFRQRLTPGGRPMSVAMTGCGDYVWVTDAAGYRYSPVEPESGLPWPDMPEHWLQLAQKLAAQAGFSGFMPDSCLINRYRPGTGMGLHQDRDEADFRAPIVSFSLGAPVLFRWGGLNRQDPAQDILLEHGDVLVWGGSDRLRFHGVKKLKRFQHPLTGDCRYNLTFRQALSLVC